MLARLAKVEATGEHTEFVRRSSSLCGVLADGLSEDILVLSQLRAGLLAVVIARRPRDVCLTEN